MGWKTGTLATAIAVVLAVPAARAEETGWLTGYKALMAFRKLERQGLMPVKVQCRDSNKRGLDLWETEYNVTVTARPPGLRYYWAVGDAFGPTRLKAEKQGYRQVSLSQYKRQKSGLTIRCAIWHK
jgi:hypothetical protein